MATEPSQPDDPLRIFRLGYDAFAWVSMIFVALITIWVIWTLFNNTPDGTASTRAYIAVQPTLTAIAGGGGGAQSDGPPAFDASAAKSAFSAEGCEGCHGEVVAGGVGPTCPPLGEIASVAAERIASSDYTGSATTVEEYIRESILEPGVYIVNEPGKTYEIAPGMSLMTAGLVDDMDEAELDNLIAWLSAQE